MSKEKKFDVLEEVEKQYENRMDCNACPNWGRIDAKTRFQYLNEDDYFTDNQFNIDWPDDPAALAAEWETLTWKQELRHQFDYSFFLETDVFDPSIVGVDPITGSIIYDALHAGYIYYSECMDTKPKLKDALYGAHQVMDWVRNLNLSSKLCNGKVPPTIFVYRDDVKHWGNIINGDS